MEEQGALETSPYCLFHFVLKNEGECRLEERPAYLIKSPAELHLIIAISRFVRLAEPPDGNGLTLAILNFHAFAFHNITKKSAKMSGMRF